MSNRFKECGLKVPDDYEVPGSRIPGERVIEIGSIDIDRSVFQKDPLEKLRLKAAKAQSKYDEMRKR